MPYPFIVCRVIPAQAGIQVYIIFCPCSSMDKTRHS